MPQPQHMSASSFDDYVIDDKVVPINEIPADNEFYAVVVETPGKDRAIRRTVISYATRARLVQLLADTIAAIETAQAEGKDTRALLEAQTRYESDIAAIDGAK